VCVATSGCCATPSRCGTTPRSTITTDRWRGLANRPGEQLREYLATWRSGRRRVLLLRSDSADARRHPTGARPEARRAHRGRVLPGGRRHVAAPATATRRRDRRHGRGHNPGLEDLAATRVGSGDRQLRERLNAKFPTGALATISFRGGWSDLGESAGRLDAYFVPAAGRPAPAGRAGRPCPSSVGGRCARHRRSGPSGRRRRRGSRRFPWGGAGARRRPVRGVRLLSGRDRRSVAVKKRFDCRLERRTPCVARSAVHSDIVSVVAA
jgi:hypothetical protein